MQYEIIRRINDVKETLRAILEDGITEKIIDKIQEEILLRNRNLERIGMSIERITLKRLVFNYTHQYGEIILEMESRIGERAWSNVVKKIKGFCTFEGCQSKFNRDEGNPNVIVAKITLKYSQKKVAEKRTLFAKQKFNIFISEPTIGIINRSIESLLYIPEQVLELIYDIMTEQNVDMESGKCCISEKSHGNWREKPCRVTYVKYGDCKSIIDVEQQQSLLKKINYNIDKKMPWALISKEKKQIVIYPRVEDAKKEIAGSFEIEIPGH